MSEIDDNVDITQLIGVCVFCGKVIFNPGMSAPSIRKISLEHIRQCKEHPLRVKKELR